MLSPEALLRQLMSRKSGLHLQPPGSCHTDLPLLAKPPVHGPVPKRSQKIVPLFSSNVLTGLLDATSRLSSATPPPRSPTDHGGLRLHTGHPEMSSQASELTTPSDQPTRSPWPRPAVRTIAAWPDSVFLVTPPSSDGAGSRHEMPLRRVTERGLPFLFPVRSPADADGRTTPSGRRRSRRDHPQPGAMAETASTPTKGIAGAYAGEGDHPQAKRIASTPGTSGNKRD